MMSRFHNIYFLCSTETQDPLPHPILTFAFFIAVRWGNHRNYYFFKDVAMPKRKLLKWDVTTDQYLGLRFVSVHHAPERKLSSIATSGFRLPASFTLRYIWVALTIQPRWISQGQITTIKQPGSNDQITKIK